MELELKTINGRQFIDVLTMYKQCVHTPVHYRRWVVSHVLKVGRIGKELIEKNNNDTSKYTKRKVHRYWADVDFAIYLCRMMDTALSKKVELILESKKLAPDPPTDSSFKPMTESGGKLD